LEEEENSQLLNQTNDIQTHAVKRKRHDSDNPTYTQAIEGRDKDEWERAIEIELKQLDDEGVIHLNETIDKPPKSATVLGSMYVLKKKRDVINGSVVKFKARLVALGNRQPPNTYVDIKSGTAKASSFKLLLAIQASTQAKAITIDVKGA